ncbi:Hypothetical predicted protein, partial [Pelobates cultripes]
EKQVVGISSLAPEYHLKWLMDLLQSDPFQEIVDVRYLLMTEKRAGWKREADDCTVGILYHTMKCGRFEISKYEEELKYLSKKLGKERVMVVIDDVEKGDDNETKKFIDNNQGILSLSTHFLLIPLNNKEKAARDKLDQICKDLRRGNSLR